MAGGEGSGPGDGWCIRLSRMFGEQVCRRVYLQMLCDTLLQSSMLYAMLKLTTSKTYLFTYTQAHPTLNSQ